jgi:Xaa-Pro aminopeptidase
MISLEGAARRTARAQDFLRSCGIDAALLSDVATVRHLTGLPEQRWPHALLLTQEESVLVSFAAGEQRAAAGRQVVIPVYPPDRRPASHPEELRIALAELLDDVGDDAASWAIDAATAPGWLSGSLREHGVGVDRITDIGAGLVELRRVKDPDEIAVIEYNARLAEAAYARAAEFIRPGVTEIAVYVEMIRTVQELAGGPVPNVGDFACGPGGGLRGGWPTDRACELGDSYVIDFQIGRNGYWTDLTRTFSVGPQSWLLDEALDLIEEAMQAVERLAVPGAAVADADRVLRDTLLPRADLGGDYLPHIVGHGVGVLNHEAPWLIQKSDERFALGDVISVEPGLYADALAGGARTEDNYVVEADGLRPLSRAPRQPTRAR